MGGDGSGEIEWAAARRGVGENRRLRGPAALVGTRKLFGVSTEHLSDREKHPRL